MSLDVCTTCRNRETCTFPRNQRIVQCEEYESDDRRRLLQERDKAPMWQAHRPTAGRPAAGI